MQVLVYAGAIMVLVIFVIMLLSLREENLGIWKNPFKQGAILLFMLLFGGLLVAAMNFSPDIPNAKHRRATNQDVYMYNLQGASVPNVPGMPPANDPATPPVVAKGNTATVGASTFLDYLLPFELVSILLLAAVIGAVVIAKRDKLKSS